MYPETPIDFSKTHFSRAGSYFVFSLDQDEQTIHLNSVRNGYSEKELGRILITDLEGNHIPHTTEMKPSVLSIHADGGYVQVCITSPKVIRFQITGDIKLCLEFNISNLDILQLQRGWRLSGWNQPIKLMVSELEGTLQSNSEAELPVDSVAFFLSAHKGECGGLAIEEFETEWESRRYLDDFENCIARVSNEFQQYLLNIPMIQPAYLASRELAAYITWSNILSEAGHVSRRAITRSKSDGGYVRTVDSAFAALSCAPANMPLAWNYFMISFDQQSQNGQLPNSITDKQISYDKARPPLQGWVLRWMTNHGERVTAEMMQEVYQPLVNATEWWFRFRSDNAMNLPCYFYSPESGWNGSSSMLGRKPIFSPDLLAYLIHQMDTLCLLASRIGKPGESIAWRNRALDLTKILIDKFWDGEKFNIFGMKGEIINTESQSLIRYIPIILGNKLPAEISTKIAADLAIEGKFFCDYGLATESFESSYFCETDHWNGSVMAPPVLLIVDGLRQTKNAKLARKIAKNFCDLCQNSGFASHYSAKTGEPLSGSSYTWAASIFQVLASYYA